jgi:NAD+ synthase (glutamine-hydrolysing)
MEKFGREAPDSDLSFYICSSEIYTHPSMNSTLDYGMLRVATAIPTVKVADCRANLEQHIQLSHQAAEQGVQLLVFPELSLTGYTCADLFQQPMLVDGAMQALSQLAAATRDVATCLCVGLPLAYANRLYNVAAVLHEGRVRAFIPKTYIPNYSEFYEARWFASGAELGADGVTVVVPGQDAPVPLSTRQLLRLGRATIGVEICEDLWVPIPPSAEAALQGAEVLVNLSASDEVLGKHAYLQQLIAAHSGRLAAAYVYASAGFGESSTDLVFAGKGIIAENGVLMAESERFRLSATLQVADIDIEKLQTLRRRQTTYTAPSADRYAIVPCGTPRTPDFEQQLYRYVHPTPFVPSGEADREARCNEIFNIQVAGLVTRLNHIQARTAVIGISGGLDSTLALLVTVRAFDKLGWSRDRIVGITMPGFGTSGRTYNNSIGLMQSLGIQVREISIRDSVNQHFRDLGIDSSVHDVTYENCQARERTQILMDASNQTGGIVIGTGDLSELALGWCTYNGDHMSMYAVNASIPKTLVRHLVQWVADTSMDEQSRAILLDIIDTPISPELIPTDTQGNIAQKTEDLVGPYELHDFFLYHYFRFGASPRKIYFLSRKAFAGRYADDVLRKWLRNFFRRFFQQQFKRSCLPDGPKVGTVSLSPRGDWRMPSDAQVRLWLDECDQL